MRIQIAAARRFAQRASLVAGFVLLGLTAGRPAHAAPILLSFVGAVEAIGVAGSDASDLHLPGVVAPGDAIRGSLQFDPTAALVRPGAGGPGIFVYDLAAPGGLDWTTGGLDFASHAHGDAWPSLDDPPASVLSAWVFEGGVAETLVISAISFADDLLLHGLPGFVEISLFFSAPDIAWDDTSLAGIMTGASPVAFTVQGIEAVNGADVVWSFGGTLDSIVPVPEPTSALLFGAGLALLGRRARRGSQAGSDSTPK